MHFPPNERNKPSISYYMWRGVSKNLGFEGDKHFYTLDGLTGSIGEGCKKEQTTKYENMTKSKKI